jgi:hypothetical protein
MQASKQSKQEKLARKLQPNQSIRSDQKKLSAQRHRPPLAPLPEPEAVEIEWFDWLVSSWFHSFAHIKQLEHS